VACASRHEMETAVSLIIGFPDETRDDLRQTVHLFVNALRLDNVEPQIALLAPLAGTPIYREYQDRLVCDHIFSDMSEQSWRQDPVEVAMIEAQPDIFPNFYAVPTRWLARSYLGELAEFLTYVATWFRWLPVALLQDGGDFLATFDGWRAWRAARPARSDDENTGLAPYYAHRRFRKEFLEFLQEQYLPELARTPEALAALLQTEGPLEEPSGSGQPATPPAGGDADRGRGRVPVRRQGLRLLDLAVDYRALVACLRQSGDLAGVSQTAVTVAFLPADGRRTQVWQLAALSATLLKLCDGDRTVEEIVDGFSRAAAPCAGVTPEQACLFGLAQLRRDGFII